MGYYIKRCNDCNIDYDVNAKFCTQCGKKFGSQDIIFYNKVFSSEELECFNTELGTIKNGNETEEKDTRKFSTASIVAFVLGIVTFFCPLPIFLAMFLNITAIIISLVDIIQNDNQYRHLLSVIAIVLSVISLAYLYSTDFFYFYRG